MALVTVGIWLVEEVASAFTVFALFSEDVKDNDQSPLGNSAQPAFRTASRGHAPVSRREIGVFRATYRARPP